MYHMLYFRNAERKIIGESVAPIIRETKYGDTKDNRKPNDNYALYSARPLHIGMYYAMQKSAKG